jgi:hypothetical protein
MAVVERGFAFVIADVVEGEIADGSEKPGAGIFDIVPVGVEFEKSFLDEVFGGLPLANKSVGIAKQWGFLILEDLPESEFHLHRISEQEHGIASGINLGKGAGGLSFHESARAGSCYSPMKTQPADFP